MPPTRPATKRGSTSRRKTALPAAPPASSEDTSPELTAREERIRQAAYSFYEQRGADEGSALDDWLKAEALVDQRNGGNTGADLQADASAAAGH